MLDRRHRFHGHGSLRYVYRRGNTVRYNSCLLKFCPNPRRSVYRVAIVVGKKVSKSAVVRNRIRRRLYEQVRLQTPADLVYDFAFLVTSPSLAEAPAEDVAQTVRSLLKQVAERPGQHTRAATHRLPPTA